MRRCLECIEHDIPKEPGMKPSRNRTAAMAASLALLLGLAACGERLDPGPPAAQASVEINRQGMKGAKDSSEAIGVVNHGDGTTTGRASGLRFWHRESPQT
jgi:hypothetical protein